MFVGSEIKHFQTSWIGRNGPLPWPPRSPDITPLDFFLWAFAKDLLYQTKIQEIAGLTEKVSDVTLTIDEAMLLQK